MASKERRSGNEISGAKPTVSPWRKPSSWNAGLTRTKGSELAIKGDDTESDVSRHASIFNLSEAAGQINFTFVSPSTTALCSVIHARQNTSACDCKHAKNSLERKLLEEIKNLNPRKRPNLLIVGPVGAGKSSFINSILSIAKGRKCSLAGTGDSDESWTLHLSRYTDGTLLQKYCLFDCMGVEPSDGKGFHIDDMTHLIKGHIRKGYNFNPASPITNRSEEYRQSPTFENQMHCVIFVMNASNISAGMPPLYIQRIKQLQDKVRRENAPRILILTKVDEICPEVQKDIAKLFYSVKVREAVKTASEVFGIEQASIHPVINYEDDFNINTKRNIPILLALRQTMHYAIDRIDYVLEKE